MSTFEIKMPKLGESITEGTIMKWSVKKGDVINEDDVLFEVSTAKVSAEIPSPVSGTILEILVQEGETAPVGAVVALVLLEGEVADDVPAEEVSANESKKEEIAVESKSAERWYSPVVSRLASEAGISKEELDRIPGTGYEGRLSKKDIRDYIEQKNRGVEAPVQRKEATADTVTKVAAAAAPAPIPEVKEPAVAPSSATAPTPVNAGDEVKEMDFVRRIIADRMVLSKKVSPHVTTVIEVDVTKLVRWRERNKETFLRHEGINLTYMPAIVEAVSKALIAFPQVNSSVDGYRFILKKNINVGIAVSLNDGNLIVPVVHNADRLSLSGLALTIDSLAAKARANKLAADDIQGGTFTITNFGSFKNIFGTPIINQPEVAILGVGYIEKKPAVVETPEGDVIAIRNKMYLSLSYDHRIVDGSLGGAFLKRIADYLENWHV